MDSIEKIYKDMIKKGMKEKYNYTNVMEVPVIKKITINRGLGEAVTNSKAVEDSVAEIMNITGQRPIITKAKKSISNFKLRQGMPIGVKVTLRGKRMYEFISKLINVSLPKIRDFRGISSKAFDGKGNYTMGLKEQIIFPEVRLDKIDKVRGMNITITTSAKSDEEAYELLRIIGMPFRK
ncbi:MAG: 50S ribosomal protein L5 [Candidatus Margulisiibacteriota bacterium]|nr:MAG: 50S ribosomal protein L5 [Candidatus Margulisiibacteriota bacterium]HAR62696.1 50S ribosomal protein L5 [Candidatus Margulisiibacteriota bacterium]HCT85161.1 50S ribosomal protein L5 [Candidatus Margulisiibacteriota bacterium]HCY36809.1 50S ribosomal protein L5 [Candidatus Margulisiibacteriota bacterium]